MYKNFAEVAKQEGFLQISSSFSLTSEIEKVHGDCFQMFADYMEQNRLFVSDVETGWLLTAATSSAASRPRRPVRSAIMSRDISSAWSSHHFSIKYLS